MMFRWFACVLCALAVAVASAQAEDPSTPAPGGGTAAPAQPSRSGDPVDARIAYLHDRLRITAEQEDAFAAVAEAMHENSRSFVPFLKARLHAITYGTAPEVLAAYRTLGEGQVDALKRIVDAFETLYGRLSESQKKIADAVLRTGAQESIVVPLVPPPFTSALSYPSLVYPRELPPPPAVAPTAPGPLVTAPTPAAPAPAAPASAPTRHAADVTASAPAPAHTSHIEDTPRRRHHHRHARRIYRTPEWW